MTVICKNYCNQIPAERGLGLTAIMNILKAGETEPISYYREVWVKYQVIPAWKSLSVVTLSSRK